MFVSREVSKVVQEINPMADAKQLELLRSAPDAWNAWRASPDGNQAEIEFARV
jgi:hypothetical protein